MPTVFEKSVENIFAVVSNESFIIDVVPPESAIWEDAREISRKMKQEDLLPSRGPWVTGRVLNDVAERQFLRRTELIQKTQFADPNPSGHELAADATGEFRRYAWA